MEAVPRQGVTTLLNRLHAEGGAAFPHLVEAVYEDLRAVAKGQMRNRFGDNLAGLTLQPTAIVNEVVMELRDQRNEFQNRRHFFAIATRLTRRLLSHYAQQRRALKRSGNWQNRAGGAEPAAPDEADRNAAAISRCLERLDELDSRKAEVVTLHVLAGLPLRRVAELMDRSLPTIERDWRFARAWLADEVSRELIDEKAAPAPSPPGVVEGYA